MWALGVGGQPRHQKQEFAELGWSAERLDAALSLFTTDAPTLRSALQSAASTELGLLWDISPLERHPVVELKDGSLLVIDPDLLMRRIVGGLLRYDIVDVLERGGDRKRARRVETCIQHLAEVYAVESLYAMAGHGPSSARVFDDAELRRAFARKGRRIADAAVDYGDAWLVVEITTSKLKRQSVTASGKALGEDLDKLVGEVEQIDATISALRTQESALTGAPASSPRRFHPLLVVAEGFPVNPATTYELRQRVEQRGLLTGADVAPLEVVDTNELGLLEALTEQRGVSVRDVLADKERSSLATSSVRDYLYHDRGDRSLRSARVTALMDKAWDLALAVLKLPEDA
jgi:hypothetical protein